MAAGDEVMTSITGVTAEKHVELLKIKIRFRSVRKAGKANKADHLTIVQLLMKNGKIFPTLPTRNFYTSKTNIIVGVGVHRLITADKVSVSGASFCLIFHDSYRSFDAIWKQKEIHTNSRKTISNVMTSYWRSSKRKLMTSQQRGKKKTKRPLSNGMISALFAFTNWAIAILGGWNRI